MRPSTTFKTECITFTIRDRLPKQPLDIVVVVPPSGLLWILVTGLHVEGIVRGPFLRAEIIVC